MPVSGAERGERVLIVFVKVVTEPQTLSLRCYSTAISLFSYSANICGCVSVSLSHTHSILSLSLSL